MKKSINNLKININSFAQKGKWQSIAVKVTYSDLFWLLVICGMIRLVFYSCFLVTTNSDSETYLNYRANIFMGQVDCYRTPVYPYFIKLLNLFGADNLFQNIVIVQSVISYLTIIIFYKTLRTFFKNKKVIVSASLIYGVIPAIINYDKCILTESISISAFVLFIYFIVNYLNKPTILKAILFTMYTFFLIMLRPSFIYLLPLVIMFWGFRIFIIRKELKNCLSGFAASFLCILLILGYYHLNYLNNGYKRLTTVSIFNNLEIIIDYDIYKNNNDSEITETIINFPPAKKKSRYGIAWTIYSQYSDERIRKFITNCYFNHPGIYAKKTLEKIYNMGFESSSSIYAKTTGGTLCGLTHAFHYIFSISFFSIYILLLFDCICIIVLWLRLKKVPWLKIIIWSVITGQLVVYFIGGPMEPQRLFVEVLPFVIILIFYYIDIILSSIDRDKLRQHHLLTNEEK